MIIYESTKGEFMEHVTDDTIVSCILSSVVGAVSYRFVLSIAISLGMKSIDFKIFSALIVTVAILIPVGKKKLESMLSKMVKKNVVNASNGEEDNNA